MTENASYQVYAANHQYLPTFHRILIPSVLPFSNCLARQANSPRSLQPCIFHHLAFTVHAKFTPLLAATITLHKVGAGVDTLGYTLSCILTSIAITPGCQVQLQCELDTARHAGLLSDAPTYDESCCLPYLTACIAESMRLKPVIGMTFSGSVPAEE
jgi:hypothetical protein